MQEPEFILCPICFLPPAEEHDGGGMIPETYYICALGHTWTKHYTED